MAVSLGSCGFSSWRQGECRLIFSFVVGSGISSCVVHPGPQIHFGARARDPFVAVRAANPCPLHLFRSLYYYRTSRPVLLGTVPLVCNSVEGECVLAWEVYVCV